MKSDDLTEPEKKVLQAAATGAVVDLRVVDSQLDSPEKWAEWGPERSVRAESSRTCSSETATLPPWLSEVCACKESASRASSISRPPHAVPARPRGLFLC
jgi:hypothetical protein